MHYYWNRRNLFSFFCWDPWKVYFLYTNNTIYTYRDIRSDFHCFSSLIIWPFRQLNFRRGTITTCKKHFSCLLQLTFNLVKYVPMSLLQIKSLGIDAYQHFTFHKQQSDHQRSSTNAAHEKVMWLLIWRRSRRDICSFGILGYSPPLRGCQNVSKWAFSVYCALNGTRNSCTFYCFSEYDMCLHCSSANADLERTS